MKRRILIGDIEPDRIAGELELVAEEVNDKAPVVFVCLLRVREAEAERGRTDASLGETQDPASRSGRGAVEFFENCCLEEFGAEAHCTGVVNRLCLAEGVKNPFAGEGTGVDERGIVNEMKFAGDVILGVFHQLFRDEVNFVGDENQPPVSCLNEIDEAFVLSGWTFSGVKYHQGDGAVVNSIKSPPDGVKLYWLLNLRATSDASGVNDAISLALKLDNLFHRVPGCPRLRGDNGTFLTQNLV